MKRTLSPKDLARAIGVSESSLKRWADDGRVQTQRTPGGHRRIAFSEAIRFIRESRAEIVQPEALGLVAGLEHGGAPEQAFHDLLSEGRSREARGWIVARYAEGTGLAELFDGPVRESLRRIGELWRDREEGVYVEHRATDICMEALREIRLAIGAREEAAVAVGGAPSGDPYGIPSLMVSTLLLDEGFQAVNLGPDTPASTLRLAARDLDARLVWLSVTSPRPRKQLEAEAAELERACREDGRALVLGGQAPEVERVAAAVGATHCANMSELAAFARGLKAAGDR